MQQIVEGLEALAVPIDSVRPMERNARQGDIPAIARSLAEFGQRRPIVVRRDTNEVTAGNHLLAAAISLGWERIAVLFVDDDEQRAVAWSLADNRTHDVGGYDDGMLDELLASLADADLSLIEATGFDAAAVLATLSPDATDFVPFSERASATDPAEAAPSGAAEPVAGAPGDSGASGSPEDLPPMDAYGQYGERAAAPPSTAAEAVSADEWVILQFRTVRGKVKKDAFDAWYEGQVVKAGGDRGKVSAVVLAAMGFHESDIEGLGRNEHYDDRSR